MPAITERYRKIDRFEQAAVETVQCPLCASSETQALLDGADLLHKVPGRFGVERCVRCGLAFTNPRPDAASMSLYYPENYVAYQKKERDDDDASSRWRRAILVDFCGYPGRRKWYRKLLLWPLYRRWRASGKSWFWPDWVGKGRVLDVGCGSGRFLWRLAGERWSAKGLDISRNASSTAREWYGVEVTVGTYPHDHFPPDSFDLVTLWNSLEHMADPRGVLRSIAAVLAPRGRVIAAVPNFASFGARYFRELWFPLDLPRHLNHFTPDTLGKTFERAGLRMTSVVALRRTSSLRKSSDYALAAGDKRLFTRLLSTRMGAGLAGRLLCSADRCDLIIAFAEKG